MRASGLRPPPQHPGQDQDGDELNEHPQAHQLVGIRASEVAAGLYALFRGGEPQQERAQHREDQEVQRIHARNLGVAARRDHPETQIGRFQLDLVVVDHVQRASIPAERQILKRSKI